jgi:hypothetical protein
MEEGASGEAGKGVETSGEAGMKSPAPKVGFSGALGAKSSGTKAEAGSASGAAGESGPRGAGESGSTDGGESAATAAMGTIAAAGGSQEAASLHGA